MKKRTRIIIFLSVISMYSLQIFADELREIKTLDEINKGTTSRTNVSKPVSNINNELKPLEKLNTSEKKEEVKTETVIAEKSAESEIKLTDAQKALQKSGIRILDISKKVHGDNKLVYAQGEDKPFTGEFGLFIGDIIEYSEAYVDGKLNGDKIWYSDEGNIIMTESYVNEKLNGEQRSYYSDGSIKAITKYKNNRVTGIEFYAQDGKLLHKSDMSTGTGEWKFFWDNGKLLEEGKYKNWVKDGTWKRYQEDGTVDSIAVYENGRLKSQTWN
ncbi:MAG: toxin-antitoxin system YwqK family antitoxin [Fusobacterium sp.]|nr:toxin-antitoxin system YwqK family antitoxin [Fusobacterium sp.]